MYTFTVVVKGKKELKVLKAYDATVLSDGSEFVVRISVMKNGESDRYYFNLSAYEIVFHKELI